MERENVCTWSKHTLYGRRSFQGREKETDVLWKIPAFKLKVITEYWILATTFPNTSFLISSNLPFNNMVHAIGVDRPLVEPSYRVLPVEILAPSVIDTANNWGKHLPLPAITCTIYNDLRLEPFWNFSSPLMVTPNQPINHFYDRNERSKTLVVRIRSSNLYARYLKYDVERMALKTGHWEMGDIDPWR